MAVALASTVSLDTDTDGGLGGILTALDPKQLQNELKNQARIKNKESKNRSKSDPVLGLLT
jgi:hypothetical protein